MCSLDILVVFRLDLGQISFNPVENMFATQQLAFLASRMVFYHIQVPDRSNLTRNALLERKWNAKWNAAGTPKERQNFCVVGARSEQERVLWRTR